MPKRHQRRTDNRVADAAAFADRFRRVDQKLHIERRTALHRDIKKNNQQNRNDENGARAVSVVITLLTIFRRL
jgi:hypothetical protein